MRRVLLLLLAGVCAPCLRAQSPGDEFRYLIAGDTFAEPKMAEQAAITAAVCEGTAEATHCDTCPESPRADAGFSLKRVILGHFLAPSSTDAFATISGCEEIHGSVGWGFLLTRRSGKWESVNGSLGLELGNCHKMQFRSRRELLVCEDYRMESFQLMHNVTAVFAKGESIGFRNLLTAADTTRSCYDQARVQKAQIDKIEFRDLNGDGIEDISFAASFGTLADSKRRQELCQAAEDGKPGVRRPEPKVIKPYRIEYLFDGLRFTLTKETQAAAGLFR